MKSTFSILILFFFCSFTHITAANETFENRMQPALLEGDTTIMQEQGTQVLTDCAGVILDPGGYENYQNNINSTITIASPASAIVTLFFSEFNIENAFDDFLIYDGADNSAPLIGTYDNMELSGQTIVSSGGPMTIVFLSDFTVNREGFVIDYMVAGGSETPTANFEVSQTTPIPLNYPVSFTDISENAGSWLYDFGDGNQSTEQNPMHSFTAPGSYDVSLTISNCSSTDTYTQTVTVQESGQLEINPSEICVTVNSFATMTAQVNLTNTGAGDLYYNFTEIDNENPNSLTVLLGTGIIPPGGTQIVNLFFFAGDLLGGTYNHDLLLQTGDASQLEFIYPAKMIVIGTPTINVSPPIVAFPQGYLDNPQIDSICISNSGTDTLHVSNITFDTPGYIVSPTTFSVPPDGEAKVYITLLAEEVGDFSGMLSIFSNAGVTETIPVLASVIDPPVGVFTPNDICLNLGQDESTLFIMGITNEGGQDLVWIFDFVNTFPDWLEFGILNGSVAPGGSQTVPIIVNSTGLTMGEYEYNATISTNNPILGNSYLNIKLIVSAPPIADFFSSNQNSCNGVVSFMDNSQGNPDSWLWEFGDGNFSEEQNPVHTYNEQGVYDISLIACNPIGCDTLSLQDYANFTEDQSNCDTIYMGIVGDTTLYNCEGYIYDSGGPDGDYAINSNYTVTVNPPGATSINVTFDEFNLENGTWDLLSIHSGEDTSAPLVGSFSGTDAPGGGSLDISSGAATFQFVSDGAIQRPGFAISYACTSPNASANFTVLTEGFCSNEVMFNNNSLFADSYFWDFGDGNTSEQYSPIHSFNSPGSYEVSLTAESDSGFDTFTETVVISDLPFALEIEVPDNIFINSPAEFSYSASSNLTEVEWTSSTGNTTTLDSPNFIFFEIGEQEITLTGTDSDNCQVTTSMSFFVDETSKIDDNLMISSFKVFPVPTNERVNIQVNLKEKSTVELSLFNILGQQILQKEFQSVLTINDNLKLSSLPIGTYYLGLWIDGNFVGKRRLILVN